jgi:transcriptional regulator with XRE-family HTH domain
MLIELGIELKQAREDLGLSLQNVAESSNISAAYLQKLERGVVDTPSPRVLRRLASSLELSYLRLLELAGYLNGDETAQVRSGSRAPAPHPLADQSLSQEEWRAVGAFIKALIEQRRVGGATGSEE